MNLDKNMLTERVSSIKNRIKYWQPLHKIVKKRVEQEYPNLYKKARGSSRKDNFKEKLYSPNSWLWITFFFVILGVVFFGLEILTRYQINFQIKGLHWFYISAETAQGMIKDRISNVATIIGFTLATCTLLINNLYEKDKNQAILFRSVPIFTVAYYAVGLLAWLLFLSLLRDFSLCGKKISTYVFTNAVLFSHYLIFVLLIGIAYLFKNIVYFLSPANLHILFSDIIRKESAKILLRDIIKNERKRIWQNFPDRKRAFYEPQLARKYFDNNVDTSLFDELIERQTDLIKDAVTKKDSKALKRSLELFNIVYQIYYDNIKDNELFHTFKQPHIIHGREDQLFVGMAKSIEIHDEYLFGEFTDFMQNHFYTAKTNNNHLVVLRMSRMLESSFSHVRPQYKNPYLKEIVRTIPNFDYRLSEDEFYLHQCFTCFLKLVQATLKPYPTESLEGFEYVMGKFQRYIDDVSHKEREHNISLIHLKHNDTISEMEKVRQQEEITKKIELYRIGTRATFAIRAWLGLLFYLKYLDKEQLKKALKSSRYKFYNFPTLVADYEHIAQSRDYLALDEWDFTERERGTVYSPCYPDSWAFYGLLLEVCLRDLYEDQIDYKSLETKFDWSFQSEPNWPFDALEGREDEWIEALEIDTDTFIKRKATFQRIIERLSSQQKLKEKQDIASQLLESQKVINFQVLNFDTWKNSTHFIPVFEYFGNVISKPINDDSLNEYPFFGYQYPKSAFVKRAPVFSNRGSMGESVGKYFKELFLKTCIEGAKKQTTKIALFEQTLNQVIKDLNKAGFQPSLIIVPSDLLYEQNLFETIQDYEPKYTQRSGEQYAFDINGLLNDDTLVMSYYIENWNKEIIVCDFKAAFRLLVGEDDTFVNKQLYINVREFTEDEFMERRTTHFDKWSENGKLSVEETDARIRNTVIVDMECYLNFEVVNASAYKVIEILPSNP